MCQYKAKHFAVICLVALLTSSGLEAQHWKNTEPVGSGVRSLPNESNPVRKQLPELLPIKFARPAKPTRPSPIQEPVATGTPIIPNQNTAQSGQPQTPGNNRGNRQLSEEPRLRRIIEGESTELLPAPIRTLGGVEIIRQRYPDGKVQIERQVAQDNLGNYYNDGFWKLFNRQGQVLAEGQFVKGVMNGFWKRWHPASGSGMFASFPFNRFQGPFLSTTTFNNGKLEGVWTMFDRQKRKVFEIPYQNGKRHGTAVWFLPNGSQVREVTFYENLIEGSLKEWDAQKNLVRHDEFISGKKILRHTTYYRPKQPESENYYLEPRLELNGDDDWWVAQQAEYQPIGPRIQHGPAFAWHDNNQMKMKGRYQQGKRIGEFIWWHANGQKHLVGSYNKDGLKSGKWIWWHPNGQKAIDGRYESDIPVGQWTWWDVNGAVQDQKSIPTENEKPDSSKQPRNVDDDDDDDDDVSKTTEVPIEIETLPNPLDAQTPNQNETPNQDDSESESSDSSSNAVEPPGGNNSD